MNTNGVGSDPIGRRFVVDPSWRRFPGAVVAGSPLRVFRMSPAGDRVLDRLERGDAVDVGTPAVAALVDRLLDAGAVHPRYGGSATHRFRPEDVTIVTPVHRRSETSDEHEEPDVSGDGVRAASSPAGLPRATVRVVVDDASEPPIPGADLRLVPNRGPGAARDAGVELVRTAIVAFVDDDVETPEGWLAPLLAHFDDPRVGLVAPRVRSAPGPGRLAAYERRRSPLDLGAVPARIRAGTRVSYVPAAALLVRVDALRAVGGFDHDLRFGEDVDLVWRLDAAGWGCRYEPSVVVRHRPRTTWAAWARQRIGYASSTAPLARRHPGALAPVRVNRWSVAAWGAAIVWPTAGLVVAAGAAAALPRRLPMLPRRVAFGLASRGTWRAGGQLASAVRRAWWPILAIAAIRSRLARRVLLLSALAAGGPVRLLDDLAASVGLWRGIARERDPAALAPRWDRWPPDRTGRAGRRARGTVRT